jgi:8-oxo-dGTP pyrophosphatase MutT (NUDIX family)
MTFEDLTHHLSHQLTMELPGATGQAEMALLKRPGLAQLKKMRKTPKQSAVMILFYPVDGVPNFCLTQRPEYNGPHSGQISFPGGKVEPKDLNLEATALRETQEEVGVNPNQVTVLGQVTEVYIPPSNFLVTPFVGYTEQLPEFIMQPEEVVEILNVPISTLLDESIVKSKAIKMGPGGIKLKAPYYDIQNKVVWGATAIMLAEVKQILIKSVHNT